MYQSFGNCQCHAIRCVVLCQTVTLWEKMTSWEWIHGKYNWSENFWVSSPFVWFSFWLKLEFPTIFKVSNFVQQNLTMTASISSQSKKKKSFTAKLCLASPQMAPSIAINKLHEKNFRSRQSSLSFLSLPWFSFNKTKSSLRWNLILRRGESFPAALDFRHGLRRRNKKK